MSHVDFLHASVDVGVEQYPFYRNRPDIFGDALQHSSKRYARLLEDVFPGFGHRRMLEVVAIAAGFPSWHAFQASTARLKENYERQRATSVVPPEVVFQPFLNALPLLVRIAEDISPTPQQKSGLERLGHRLASALSAVEPKIRDVIAKYHGAQSWEELCSRKPEDSKSPLYTFTSDSEGGRFRWSFACYELVEELDELWHGQPYDALPDNEKEQARNFVTQLIAKRPDFLEGLLVKAEILTSEGQHQEVGAVLELAIRQADAMMPARFKGEISWYTIENRFYHRLLYSYMEWCVHHGSLKEAIALARRILRVNPSDNMGVRIRLPVLLTLDGNFKSAAVALRRLEEEDTDGHVAFVLSACEFAMGNPQTGAEWFIRSLFELPVIRAIVEEDEIPDDRRDKEWYRNVIPDMETMVGDYDMIIERYPMVYDVLDTILDDPYVSEAEEQAATLFRKVPTEVDGGIDYFFKWEAFKKESAERLAAEHYRRWSEEFAISAGGSHD